MGQRDRPAANNAILLVLLLLLVVVVFGRDIKWKWGLEAVIMVFVNGGF